MFAVGSYTLFCCIWSFISLRRFLIYNFNFDLHALPRLPFSLLFVFLISLAFVAGRMSRASANAGRMIGF